MPTSDSLSPRETSEHEASEHDVAGDDLRERDRELDVDDDGYYDEDEVEEIDLDRMPILEDIEY
jgi:hypothetical protein